jgi:hypothetical protein
MLCGKEVQAEISSRGIHRQNGPRQTQNMTLTDAERAKAFIDRRTAKRVSACQENTGDATIATNSLMEWDIEMRSADTDMDMDESTGPGGGVNLRQPK